MKWFFSYFSLNNIKYKLDISSKLESYYEKKSNGITNIYYNDKFYYTEFLTNNSKKINIDEEEDIIIIGDIELDNIEEILQKEQIEEKSETTILKILYKKYGDKFLDYLYGRFSFLIIDNNKNEIKLIRDQFGLKQLFYYINNEGIALSNNLFLLNDFYNETRISKRYLSNFLQYNGICDFEETPYENIYRVRMSELITYNYLNKNLQKLIYWNLENSNPGKYEFNMLDEFKNLLYQSTYTMIRDIDKTSLALSGGVDSSVLFSILAPKKIVAYSAVFDEVKSCDERKYIEKLAEMYKVDDKIKYVYSDQSGLLEGFPNSFFYTSEPHINILNKKFSEELFEKALIDGKNYMVDGFFSDHILTGTILYLLDNLSLKNGFNIIKAINTFAFSQNVSFWFVVKQYLVKAKMDNLYIPEIDYKISKAFHEKIKNAKKFNGKDIIIQIISSITRNFGDLELAPRYQIECIHPFVNRKIVEYLYYLPGNMRLHNGTPKYILREAFRKDIPPEIMDKINKTQHVELSQKGLRENWGEIFNILKEGIITKLNFVKLSKEEWIQLLLEFRSGQTFNDNIFILITLELWLNKIQNIYGEIVFY
ncbi:asparagine synthase-related protein [Anaerocolumna chitinilytica]|uniref:asparagine synthase (glutamine-hydrolyzing) n=1 Tax=Anaerocolumna chitinilytica TaxID=1727145 RepID=A0A7I8DLZ7_9FIRM|nr:asparagine synthase-related protein [Anaerocolumna chitinilytica]BCJ98344.1 hypothetical protein bsdcttw_13850 [Anaerocolumna chitinilytica]